jgi:hypothetical protein
MKSYVRVNEKVSKKIYILSSVFNIKDHKQKQSTRGTYNFEKVFCSRKQKTRMVICWFPTPLYINCSFTSFLSMQTCTYKKKKNDLIIGNLWDSVVQSKVPIGILSIDSKYLNILCFRFLLKTLFATSIFIHRENIITDL